MAQLLVRLQNEDKAKMLTEFLSALTFVNSVELTGEKGEDDDLTEDFFSLAGLSGGREISQVSIRNNAWPEQKQ